MKRTLIAVSVIGISLVAIDAIAEEKTNVRTLKQVDVVGSPRRPSVVIELTKARMRLPPSTPTLSGAAKVTDAVKKDPF